MKRRFLAGTVALFTMIAGSLVEAQTPLPSKKFKNPLGIAPGIKTFEINYVDSITASQSVTLYNTLVNAASASHYYRASESSSFAGASWKAYSGSPTFNLSSGDGQKTVYFQVKNDSGTSAVASDSITYQRLPSVTAFKINSDAASTETPSVTITNTTTGVVTHYRVSADPNFGGASWAAYCGSTSYSLSSGAGQKTVYFQTKNQNGSSNTASDSITYSPPPVLVTEALDYQRAKEAGATFADASDCPASGQSDWNQGCDHCQPGVLFRAGGSTVSGCKADPEAYANFTLKNGWKVKQVSVTQVDKMNRADWQWKSGPPAIGSTNPYIRIHIWAEPVSGIWVGVKIMIEGPEGTNPYQ